MLLLPNGVPEADNGDDYDGGGGGDGAGDGGAEA